MQPTDKQFLFHFSFICVAHGNAKGNAKVKKEKSQRFTIKTQLHLNTWMLVNRWTLTFEHNVQSDLRGSPFY